MRVLQSIIVYVLAQLIVYLMFSGALWSFDISSWGNPRILFFLPGVLGPMVLAQAFYFKAINLDRKGN